MPAALPLWMALCGWLVAAVLALVVTWLYLDMRALQHRHEHMTRWGRTWRDEALATAEKNGDLACQLANLEHAHANLQDLYAALTLYRLAASSLRLLPWMVAKGQRRTGSE